ncbi:sortase A [Pilibacter termitis]|uniref:Sortase A n=1 Tax=Pilibacter termitis TaxID=263852 RepID=A0A1T4KBQ0_9ENTE|nr:class C sortase [Pilibacter termitis]SJZ39822.1 sortase A [Pilibacter termitis]
MKLKPTTYKKLEFLLTLGFVLTLAGAVGIFSYPHVMNALNDRMVDEILTNKHVEEKTAEKLSEQMKQRQEVARQKALQDPYSAESLHELSYDPITIPIYAKHVIGEIYLPTIKHSLPIFDNSSEQFLQRGATWLATSSDLTGGVGKHSIVAGHSGIPHARLFNEVPKLKVGDLILYKIANEYYAYKIFEQKKVTPDQSQKVLLDKNRDLTTLVTCVPIGINSHRLLITGERVPFTPTMMKEIENIQQEKKKTDTRIFLLLGSGCVLLIIVLFLVIRNYRKGRGERK